MAIKTTPKDISVHADPLSFIADISILSGSPAQTYSKTEGEYLPDRSVVPCLLMPQFIAYDPEGVVNGERAITSVKWYEGTPKTDDSNLIIGESSTLTTGIKEGYIISDTGTPTYSLKVKKNFEFSNATNIYCIFTVADTRVNKNMTIERFLEFHSDMVQGAQPSLKIMNQPDVWYVDPLKAAESENGSWLQEVTAQLFLGEEMVDDANAMYYWEKCNRSTGVWTAFTEEDLASHISGMDENGYWGKTITIDTRFFEEASFRCTAEYYEGDRPTVFGTTAKRATTAIACKLPKSLNVDLRQTAGAKINAAMTTKVSFECVITANNNPIDSSKYDLFGIEWYARSEKAGVNDKFISKGKTLSFTPKSLGFDNNYAISIYAKVTCYRITGVVAEDGVWIVTDEESNTPVVDSIFV